MGVRQPSDSGGTIDIELDPTVPEGAEFTGSVEGKNEDRSAHKQR